VADWWDDPSFGESTGTAGQGSDWWNDPSFDQAKSTASYLGDQFARGVADIPELAGDAVAMMYGGPALMPSIAKNRPVSSRIQQIYNVIAGPEQQPTSTPERYAGAVARGLGNAVVPVGSFNSAKGIISALMAGVGSNVGRQVGSDISGGNPDAEMLGSIIGGAAGGIPHVIETARTGSLIAAGAQHPDFDALFDGVLSAEGGGTIENPRVNPKTGAEGPTQVMQGTKTDPGYGIRPSNGTEADNLRVGRQYFAAMLGKYGDPEKATAAYNWGPGHLDHALSKYGDNWLAHAPEETQQYINKVLGHAYGEGTAGSVGRPVAPMDPRDMAEAMNDQDMMDALDEQDQGVFPRDEHDFSYDPEFDEQFARGEVDDQGYHDNSMVEQFPGERLPPLTEDEQRDFDALGLSKDADVTDIASARRQKYSQEAQEADARHASAAQEVLSAVRGIREATEAGQPVVTLGELQQLRADIDAMRYIHSRNPVVSALLDQAGRHVDATIAQMGGKPRAPNSVERFMPDQAELPAGVANDTILDEPPAGGGQEPPGGGAGNSGGEEPPQGPEPDPRYEGLSPEEKLSQALKDAGPVSQQQLGLYEQERSRRAGKLAQIQRDIPGEAGYRAQLAAMGGELPKPIYEPIRQNFTEADITALTDRIRGNNWMLPYQKATAEVGLHQLLDGRMPGPATLQLLQHVLPDDAMNALGKRLAAGKISASDIITNTLNIPRALMASFDLSAPLRQGVFMVGRKEFYSSFAKMMTIWGKELTGNKTAYDELINEIKSRPTYGLMRKAGLAITDADSANLSQREEAFISNWAEKIPVIGKGVKISDHAYTGFLNKLRADTFDNLVNQSQKAGIGLEHNTKALKAIGNYVNNATGRGDLGKWTQAAPALSNIFFSPRLIASRLRMLNPATYAKLAMDNPVVAKQAIRDLFTFGSIAGTVLGIAALSGAEVSTNPTSADFGKIKIGDTRYDILGGFQQYIRLGAELISGERTNPEGETTDLTAGKYGQATRGDVAVQFLRNKLSPVASFVADFLYGKDSAGNKFDLKSAAAQRSIPLLFQDINDAYQEYGISGAAEVAVPGAFGVGVQTYKPYQSKGKNSDLMKAFDFGGKQKGDWWDDPSFNSEK
jgi:hypothetical protein